VQLNHVQVVGSHTRLLVGVLHAELYHTRLVGGRGTEARARAAGRLAGRANAELGGRETARACRLDAPGEDLLRAAVERFGLSARAYHRILRVARTIADLAGRDRITPEDLAEAIGYRVPAGR
jgi:magnesium chelatase family protein